MKIKRVRVTKSSSDAYWYLNKIGKEFYVFHTYPRLGDLKYKVIFVGTHEGRPMGHYIQKEDFEILEEFEGDVIETVTISIDREDSVQSEF